MAGALLDLGLVGLSFVLPEVVEYGLNKLNSKDDPNPLPSKQPQQKQESNIAEPAPPLRSMPKPIKKFKIKKQKQFKISNKMFKP